MPLSIDELSSLIQVVNKNRVKQIEIIGEASIAESNIQKLYDLIARGSVTEDEEAKNVFFDEGPYQDIYYSRLKRKLKKRLINTLFFIDVNQPNFTDLQKAYYTCYKQVTAVKILIARSGRKPAIRIAEELIKKALKYTFTDIIIELARILRMHFANIEGNQKKFIYYSDLFNEHLKIYQLENVAEFYYAQMIIHFANSCSAKPELVAESNANVQELQSYLKVYSSYKLDLFSYLVFILYYEVQNDHINTVKACSEAIKRFESKPHLISKPFTINFLMKQLSSYVILRNFDQGEYTANKCLHLVQEGSINWLLTLDYYLRLLFYSKNWNMAYEIYLLALEKGDVQNQYQGYAEPWKIHEAFIYYLISLNKIKCATANKEKKSSKFRLSKFLNEVPNYSKDKRGINITIIIVQILFLLHQKKYGAIIDKTEALKTYSHRYLRRDDTFRSNCFIKMLLCLPAASFHKAGVIRRAKKYKNLLKSVPLHESNQSVEIEYIPYEYLWDFVLESLDNKFH